MPTPTLQKTYQSEVLPALKKDLKESSPHAVPSIKLIKLNIGMGRWLGEGKDYSELSKNLATIAGQKPVTTLSRKSISNFKLRENIPNGLSVTLRGSRAYYFLEKFINVVAPRIRDFRGFSPKSFDGHGNYSIGLKDYQVFPEITADQVTRTSGLQITIVTTTESDEKARQLLTSFNFPFKKPSPKPSS